MIKESGPIGRLSPNKPIKIIGGGISGLLMGYYLKKNNFSFTIYEKDKLVGGKIGTTQTSFGPAEKAANAVFSNDDVIELLNELKIPYYKANRKLKKYVWRSNKPQTPPISILEIIKVIIRLPRKIDTTDIESKSVYDFFSPLLGEKVSDEVLSAALGGIYAEDAKKLHFKSLFDISNTNLTNYFSFIKAIIKKKKSQKHKATSISFDGGMQLLIDYLRKDLAQFIETGHSISPLDKNELNDSNFIICTDAIDASKILENISKKISSHLNEITYNSVSTVTVFTGRPISFLSSSFGLLFKPLSRFNSLGILSNSQIYPKRVNDESHNSYTFIVKGEEVTRSEIDNDLEYLKQTTAQKSILSTTITPWKRAIPVYDLNRYEAIQKLRIEFLNNGPEGVVIFGNYIDGISIREMLSHSKSFASSQ